MARKIKRIPDDLRFRCVRAGCGRPLQVTWKHRDLTPAEQRQWWGVETRTDEVHWVGHLETNNLFCTLRCAVLWAMKHYALQQEIRDRYRKILRHNKRVRGEE